ncbi:hypothetical protein GQ55_5G140500 [Panicum hallii var. hallii]|uniref:Uncharacterized protein n=1 Tax=Panicum hallii var. hallii TaxID=1504633 RepID=A0A2T7DG52_9POAL|nr:hypothetical protein GQ55_5G140500 [Panicum hallii var. hallii]
MQRRRAHGQPPATGGSSSPASRSTCSLTPRSRHQILRAPPPPLPCQHRGLPRRPPCLRATAALPVPPQPRVACPLPPRWVHPPPAPARSRLACADCRLARDAATQGACARRRSARSTPSRHHLALVLGQRRGDAEGRRGER